MRLQFYINCGLVNEGDNINVRPLLVQSISSNQLNPKVIMVDNPEWEVWYDVSYRDVINIKTSEGQTDITAKGRII